LENILDEGLAKRIRSILGEFYNTLKSSEELLRFVFITGVSKFAHTSVFSKLNHLNDITLDDDYSCICGITPGEMESFLGGHLDRVLDSLKRDGYAERYPDREALTGDVLEWYDGYSWDGRNTVINPFSLLNFLKKVRFSSFWFGSGSPSFLIRLIRERGPAFDILRKDKYISETQNAVDIGAFEPVPVMFQTGYLTVARTDRRPITGDFPLVPPNHEVRSSLCAHLLGDAFNVEPGPLQRAAERLREALKGIDSAKAEEAFGSLLSSIPHNLHVPLESYYHTVFYFCIGMLGQQAEPEVYVGGGRIDAVLVIPSGGIHVIEMKHVKLPSRERDCIAGVTPAVPIAGEAAEARTPDGGRSGEPAAAKTPPGIRSLLDRGAAEALRQITGKGYHLNYLGRGRKVWKTAIVVCGRIHVRVAFEEAVPDGPEQAATAVT
ncbi:MAG: ATP-binding protein, partial [Deltaproteobacteria bacterium]|nr:ATP-binding protein [Deltaproteobacteria bacterium]